MIPRNAEAIAQATGGRLAAGDAFAMAHAVSIDSRAIPAAACFFAIRGETHDGHDFAAAAAAAGATVVVASKPLALPDHVTLVLVDDTTRAIGALAQDERRRRGLRVVAITGSSGKTTTRALTAAACAVRYRTGSSPGNLNNQWGLPLSILGLPDDAEVAVLEIGMNAPGEIAALTRIAEPNIGVVTNVGTAHIGAFGSIEGIAREKSSLLYELPDDGVGVVHAGSPELMALAERSGRRLVRFGINGAGIDLAATEVATDLVRGTSFKADGTPVTLALWGMHAVENALAALGAARALDIPLAEAAPALRAIVPLAGRGRVVRCERGVVVVDETYNANPSAMRAVLRGLAATRARRKVAVLGDMLELGDLAPNFHRELGTQAAQLGIDCLHAVGTFARTVADAARAGGVARVFAHDDAAAAASAVPASIEAGDLVVIKGSRGVRLEKVLDAVIAEFGEERKP